MGAASIIPRKGGHMRQTTVFFAAVLAFFLLIAGTALADTFDGDDGDNTLLGTDGRDRMSGFDGSDTLRGFGGRDRISGGNDDDALYGGRKQGVLAGGLGADRIYGGAGDDYVSSIGDNAVDYVDCGAGTDTVDQSLITGPDQDDVFVNCEKRAG